jgi:hypothetical protein
MDPLNGRKLEQTVRGSSRGSSGKRVDALMKTRAEVSSMCFVEVKRHDTTLLSAKPYRSGVWPISSEVAGGVAQIQERVRAAVGTLTSPLRPRDQLGSPTGEEVHNVEPRSFLIVGRLSEFSEGQGVNEEKFV